MCPLHLFLVRPTHAYYSIFSYLDTSILTELFVSFILESTPNIVAFLIARNSFQMLALFIEYAGELRIILLRRKKGKMKDCLQPQRAGGTPPLGSTTAAALLSKLIT